MRVTDCSRAPAAQPDLRIRFRGRAFRYASRFVVGGQVGAPSAPLTPEEIETGRKYGAMIAQELVNDIRAMGMPAIEAGPESSPQVGDGIIRGYIISTEGGDTGGFAKRFVIGFGAGTAEMDTVVEGYAMTPQRLRKLGSGSLTSSGNRMPGMVVPAAVDIATASPVGLIVVGGAKIVGAASGRTRARTSRKGDCRPDCGSAQDQVSEPRLDSLRLIAF
ncbi:MAG TPA: DUF4410 domain-containing protein [Candidatus Binataceae bacterium]|nr:DUF4410 domain-containing protein [Candidatus Binataceae bacterium]